MKFPLLNLLIFTSCALSPISAEVCCKIKSGWQKQRLQVPQYMKRLPKDKYNELLNLASAFNNTTTQLIPKSKKVTILFSSVNKPKTVKGTADVPKQLIARALKENKIRDKSQTYKVKEKYNKGYYVRYIDEAWYKYQRIKDLSINKKYTTLYMLETDSKYIKVRILANSRKSREYREALAIVKTMQESK